MSGTALAGFSAKPAGLSPVSNGAEALQAMFPKARITSGYRSPNHPLSRANPKSWHTQSHAAVDVAAIPGMTFEQAKAALGKQYGLIEAIDEYRNPSKNATGGHWHFVLGKR